MPGQLHMYMYVTMMMTRIQMCIITENNNIDMMDGGKVFHYKYEPLAWLGKDEYESFCFGALGLLWSGILMPPCICKIRCFL